VPGLFDDLIQRHQHVLRPPTTQPQLKSEARVLLFRGDGEAAKCRGPCAGNLTCPEACSKLLGRSKPLPPFRPGNAPPCRPISLARTASGKHDILLDRPLHAASRTMCPGFAAGGIGVVRSAALPGLCS
jgi:hypothetical protein